MAIDRFYTNFVAKNGLIEVWRRTPTVDVYGNTGTGAYAKASETTGVINTATQAENVQASQQNVNMTHKMYCPITADIAFDDQIRLNLGSGKYDIYRVVGNTKDTISRGHHLKIMLDNLGVDNQDG